MQKPTSCKTNAKPTRNTDPLVGRWFHSFTEDAQLQWQGQIIAKVEPGYYLVQTYEWIIGEESTQHLVTIDQMKTWLFHPSDEAMRDHYYHHMNIDKRLQ
jgi:hypothetical protein